MKIFRLGRESGQAMVEYIIVLPSLLLLILGSIQFALVFMAKSTLDLAAFDGARNGALYSASNTHIKTGIAEGLAPLYQKGMSGGPSLTGAAEARLYADAVAFNPLDVEVDILNPSAQAFQDFAQKIPFVTPAGAVSYMQAIPNARLLYKPTTPGPASKESIQDANLLKIQVHYCYPLIIPLVNTTIRAIMSLVDPLPSSSWVLTHASYIGKDTSLWDQACYAQGGMPLVADGTALMQSPAE
ncbi:MAG: TadE/TadG family type IV pilus assembly protein [Gammaproteobacteria bacterium]